MSLVLVVGTMLNHVSDECRSTSCCRRAFIRSLAVVRLLIPANQIVNGVPEAQLWGPIPNLATSDRLRERVLTHSKSCRRQIRKGSLTGTPNAKDSNWVRSAFKRFGSI